MVGVQEDVLNERMLLITNTKNIQFLKTAIRSSPVAWWLGFWAFSAVGRVQSLMGELRTRKLRSAAKEKKQQNSNDLYLFIPLR